jgi:hypothetical protein
LGGVRSVHLVGEHDVREERALHEAQLAVPRGAIFFEDVGARDVRRHQVGRELNAVEREVQHLGERADEQRLREAGHPDEQAVPPGEEADQQVIHHVALTDHALLDLLHHRGAGLRQRLDCLQVLTARRISHVGWL